MIYIEMPLWIYILTIVLLCLALIAIFTAIIMGMVIEQKQKKAIEKTYSEETEQDLIDDLRENMKSQQILLNRLEYKEEGKRKKTRFIQERRKVI